MLLPLLLLLTLLVAPTPAGAVALPSGFQQSVVFSGLVQPTAVQFASDGRVFVAEKSGLIKVFDSLTDTTPTIFADFTTLTHNFWDRGLLGLALHPNFPAQPYVYILYTFDHMPGGPTPTWGTPGAISDSCPSPPGETLDGCVVTGRVSRLTALDAEGLRAAAREMLARPAFVVAGTTDVDAALERAHMEFDDVD